MKTVALDATNTTGPVLTGAPDDGPGAGRDPREAAREALRQAMAKPSFRARVHLVRSVLAER